MTHDEAVKEVIEAAQSVSHAYAAGGGYTVPLSITLRRLNDAVLAWLAVSYAESLASDTNGFDRSQPWSHSNEQTDSPEAQRRAGCASAEGRLARHQAQAAPTPQPQQAGEP